MHDNLVTTAVNNYQLEKKKALSKFALTLFSLLTGW